MSTQKEKMMFRFRDPFAMIFPVLLYVVLENMFGLNVAVGVSLPISVFMFVYKLFDKCLRRLDWYMFPSICFILMSAVLSYRFRNSLLEPIVSEIVIATAFLFTIIFYRQVKRLIVSKQKKMLGLRENLKAMLILDVVAFFVFLVHIANYLIVYSLNPQKITGKMDFYEYLEIFLFVGLGVFAYLRMTWLKSYFEKEVFLPILTKEGNVCGFESKSFVYSETRTTDEKNVHPLIRVLFIYENKLLLHNHPTAIIEARRWDHSISSYLLYGESYEEGLLRMTKEMYGVEKCALKFLLKYTYENACEIQQVYLFYMQVKKPLMAEEKKVNVKLWTPKQLIENKNTNIFSEKLEKEIDLLRKLSFPGLFDKDV